MVYLWQFFNLEEDVSQPNTPEKKVRRTKSPWNRKLAGRKYYLALHGHTLNAGDDPPLTLEGQRQVRNLVSLLPTIPTSLWGGADKASRDSLLEFIQSDPRLYGLKPRRSKAFGETNTTAVRGKQGILFQHVGKDGRTYRDHFNQTAMRRAARSMILKELERIESGALIFIQIWRLMAFFADQRKPFPIEHGLLYEVTFDKYGKPSLRQILPAELTA